jgi:DNA-binding LacI/PurR family transcriptional regulator
MDEAGFSCVGVDDKAAAKRITQHLIDHGHSSIAHLKGAQGLSIGRKRLEGFMEAMRENRLEVADEWIVESGLQEKGGYEAMKKLLDLPAEKRPRAVFAVNDPAAFGAIEAIREGGLTIPDDIAIVGFSDDIRAELLPVPLTTVHQPAYEVGKKAAETLLGTINGENESVENIEVLTQMKIRLSCGTH